MKLIRWKCDPCSLDLWSRFSNRRLPCPNCGREMEKIAIWYTNIFRSIPQAKQLTFTLSSPDTLPGGDVQTGGYSTPILDLFFGEDKAKPTPREARRGE